MYTLTNIHVGNNLSQTSSQLAIYMYAGNDKLAFFKKNDHRMDKIDMLESINSNNFCHFGEIT